MTVGEPEINLNTWGLKYVRKAVDPTKTTQGGSKDIQSRTTSHLSQEDITVGSQASRQSDSVGDTKGVKQTHEQTSDKRSGKTRLGGQEKETYTTTGRQEGATSTGKESMTSEGTVAGAKSPAAHGKHGKEAPTGSFGTAVTPARNSKDTRNRGKKPEGLGSAPKDLKRKAELDLAIIKCKLLKATSLGRQGKFGEDNSGAAGVGIDASKLSKKPQDKTDTSNTKYSTAEGESVSEKEYKRGGDKITDPDHSAPKGQSFGDKKKSEDEIVHKAIELINQAYSEIDKKHDFIEETRPVRPAKRDDDDETKKAEKPFGKVLDEEGRPDEYTKEEHAEHDSNKEKADDEKPKAEKPKKKKEDWEKRGEYMSPEQLYADRDTFY